jgi:hypothetical protein
MEFNNLVFKCISLSFDIIDQCIVLRIRISIFSINCNNYYICNIYYCLSLKLRLLFKIDKINMHINKLFIVELHQWIRKIIGAYSVLSARTFKLKYFCLILCSIFIFYFITKIDICVKGNQIILFSYHVYYQLLVYNVTNKFCAYIFVTVFNIMYIMYESNYKSSKPIMSRIMLSQIYKFTSHLMFIYT